MGTPLNQMTHTLKPSYRQDWMIKDYNVCSCGETWAILSTQYDNRFEWQRHIDRIGMFLHRAYACPKLTFGVNRNGIS